MKEEYDKKIKCNGVWVRGMKVISLVRGEVGRERNTKGRRGEVKRILSQKHFLKKNIKISADLIHYSYTQRAFFKCARQYNLIGLRM